MRLVCILYVLMVCETAVCLGAQKVYIASGEENTMFGMILPYKSIIKCKHTKVTDHLTIVIQLAKDEKIKTLKKKLTNDKIINAYSISKLNNNYIIRVYFNKESKYLFTKCRKNSINVYVKNRQKKHTILLDPGHGGRDPGTSSGDYIKEKDITLVFSKAMKAALEATGRYEVYLTRNEDMTLQRAKRLAIIKKINPDIFISIHADNVSNPDVSGISVYTYNYDTKMKLAGNTMFDDSEAIFNKEVTRDSDELAGAFLKYVPQMCKIKKNTHRTSNIRILKNKIPSILIETGYISNEKDKILLNSDIFRDKLSQSLVYSLDDYFMKE